MKRIIYATALAACCLAPTRGARARHYVYHAGDERAVDGASVLGWRTVDAPPHVRERPWYGRVGER